MPSQDAAAVATTKHPFDYVYEEGMPLRPAPTRGEKPAWPVLRHKLYGEWMQVGDGWEETSQTRLLDDHMWEGDPVMDAVSGLFETLGAPKVRAMFEEALDHGIDSVKDAPQALLDLYTIREKKGDIRGLHVAIIGDIRFSRVARSNIFALLTMGAQVTLVGPSTLVPREFEQLGAKVTHDLDEILSHVDVVNLLRIQHERQRKEYFPGLGEYIRFFGLTKTRAKLLKPDCLIMHPGPINRGVEIDSELADSAQSVILEQVTNGLAVRMAVLYLCSGVAAS